LIAECSFEGPPAGLAVGPSEASCRELFHPARPERDIIELGGAENNARGAKVSGVQVASRRLTNQQAKLFF